MNSKITSLFLFLVSFVFIGLQSIANDKGYEVSFQQNRGDMFTLNFSIEDYGVYDVVKNGQTFTAIKFPGSVKTVKAGWAELPFLNASVQLSPDKNVTIEVVDFSYVDIDLEKPLLPSRGTIYRNQDPSTIPYVIDPASIVDAWYPHDLFIGSEPYIMRDVRGENIHVYPFQYNPVQKKLRVYTSMTLRVVENGEAPVNPIANESTSIAAEMKSVYESMFVNYNKNPYRWTQEVGDHGEMLVIYTSRDATVIQPWITWKKQKGIKVTELQVATGTNVKTNIQTAYTANTNLLYVLLVGDWADIKSDLGTSASAPTDPMLGCVVGGDNYHDIIIGRFSASSTNHVTVQADKSINYEKTPEIGGTWYSMGLGIGSDEGSGIGDDGEIDYTHIDNIKEERLIPFSWTSVTEAYGASVATTTVSNAINAGLSVINYCGHGGHDVWVTSNYAVTNANAATNGSKLPYVFSVACVVGEFHTGTDCLAEALLRRSGGGAVATWMATINQPWTPPMRGQDYANDILTQGFSYTTGAGNGTNTTYGKTTYGSITFNAAALMIAESTATDDWDTYKTWTVFGDPNLQCRTMAPKAITITNPSVTPGSYTTQIQVDGAPFQNALVSLYKAGDPQPFSALTDASGNVTIAHSLSGTIKLTVTGFNLATYSADHVIAVAEPPVCNFSASATTVTAGATVTFTDLSTNYPSTWNWTLTGGTPNTSTLQNPAVVYNTPGVYTVSLYCANTAGNDTETKNNYITVNAITTPPVANFSASATSVTPGSSINFTDLSTNLPNSWAWTFDGGTPGTSTTQNPTGIVYNTPGTYTVTLVATNSFGSDTETKTSYITVTAPEYPDATGGCDEYISRVVIGTIDNASACTGYGDYTAISANVTPGTGYPITITNALHYNGDVMAAWADWNIDGDFDDAGETFTISYAAGTSPTGVGTGTITPPVSATIGEARLRVRLGYNETLTSSGTTTYGEVEDYTLNVMGAAVAPVANFSASATTVCSGGSITFTDNSTNSPTSWSWNFGGGATNSTTQNPTVVFNTPGTYTIALTATNSAGSNTKTNTNYITVYASPTGSVSSTNVLCYGGNTGTATVTATGGTSPYTYSWTGGGSTASVTGLTAGTYNITVTDSHNCKYNSSVTVTQPTVLAIPTITPVNESSSGACDGQATANVTGGTVAYSYLWSNGQITNPATGLCSGIYNVTVTDANGCSVNGNVTITFTSDITEVKTGSYTVYPNPTDGLINVRLNGLAADRIVILDVLGKAVKTVKVSGDFTQIDLGSFENGMYFIEIYSTNKKYTTRIVVE
ncbi:MAG: hypothetical protein A2W91_19040 [Bacteroidetes bacterium GWF2_38_335]|nr:MAG: hypothetical protein A2W91_19040 [Bacteroidetes bacterium GWF2_38_335]OFY80233.1 MAG: hypothetical protein A2281_17155 [Bacteroidetes bacterium RIFOXYA12_FULL_38_20]HBS88740.1 hypothetical protein [Bacteroidales bacterium]